MAWVPLKKIQMIKRVRYWQGAGFMGMGLWELIAVCFSLHALLLQTMYCCGLDASGQSTPMVASFTT